MAEPVFVDAGAGRTIGNPVGGSVEFKVVGKQSDAHLFAFETVVAPGEGPPLHVHANEDETLYVLEGRARFKLGDEMHEGGAGALAFIPRGVRHTFQNAGDAPLRMLAHFTPAGMEQFFTDFAAVPEPGPDTFKELGAMAGMTVVGPPLGHGPAT